MLKLTAVKEIRLSGRRIYRPGEHFEIEDKEGRLLKAIGKATDFVEPVVVRDAIREELRSRAEALGVEVDGRWGVERLEEEIAGAEERAAAAEQGRGGGHYRRRDMRAEDEE